MHFLAIEAAPHIKEKMMYIQERLIELPGVVAVKEPRFILARLKEEKHIQERLKKAVADFCSFNIDVKGIGVFPHHRHVKSVWAGAPALKNLQAAIEQEFGPLALPVHSVIAGVKNGKVREDVLKHVRQLENHSFGSMKVDIINILVRHNAEEPWRAEGFVRLE
ncbi:MAG: 2'-5' RNA ligase family protein [Candidatus Aenigmarchaeota archaeon]|nr:2'-5' RNA ligase family protein [Candidatus Aenigmarchaeota archaeon]